MKSPLTTLCYIEKDGQYLMLHRVSKKNDVNKDKWIGIGGHFEEGESPEECLLREAREETGLTLTSWKFRGLVTFIAEGWQTEYMCLYTADAFTGELRACDEGVLEWVPKGELPRLNLWEGDKIFLRLIAEEAPFFSLKLKYEGDVLRQAVLDGRELELFDICDAEGRPTGLVTERSVAHMLGTMHRTVHVWVARRRADGGWQVLLQKRSAGKDSFPGRYDTSCAGHVDAGDDYALSAHRELLEELGIDAQPGDLQYITAFDGGEICEEFHGRPFRDHEICAVYAYLRPVDETKLRLQPEEVESVRWMDYEECRARMEADDPQFCSKNLDVLLALGHWLSELP